MKAVVHTWIVMGTSIIGVWGSDREFCSSSSLHAWGLLKNWKWNLLSIYCVQPCSKTWKWNLLSIYCVQPCSKTWKWKLLLFTGLLGEEKRYAGLSGPSPVAGAIPHRVANGRSVPPPGSQNGRHCLSGSRVYSLQRTSGFLRDGILEERRCDKHKGMYIYVHVKFWLYLLNCSFFQSTLYKICIIV